MGRYNKIFLGPATENKPQVQEMIAAASTKPGYLVVVSSGEFALAGAATVGKVDYDHPMVKALPPMNQE